MRLRLLLLLLPMAGFAASLAAQDDTEKRSPTLQELEKVRDLEEGGDLEKAEAENTGPRGGLRNHMTMVVAMKPRRIAPGSAGTMQLILAMRNDAVLLPGSQLNILLPEQLGPLVPGSWRLQEPGLGKLDTAFQGQPVYDNTAVVDIDVQVMPDATYGLHRFAFRVEAEITDGPSGDARGVFMDTVNGQVEVGDALPTPVVVASPAAGGPAGDGESLGGGEGVSGTDGSVPGVSSDAHPGQDGRVAAPSGPAEAGGASPVSGRAERSADAAEEGMPTFLLVGGGVVLLLIGLLVVFRGR